MSAYAQLSGHLGQDVELCELKHNFAAPARLCFKNCAATLCFPPFFPNFKASLTNRDRPHATTGNI